MMKNKPKKLYIPALSIAAVVLLLILVIAISTYKNLNRDRSTIISFLDRQGLGVFKAVETAAEMAPASSGGRQVIQNTLNKISEIDDVFYIYITNSGGTVIYHSGAAPDKDIIQLPDFGSVPGAIVKRIRYFSDDRDIYEMAKSYLTPDKKNEGDLPDISPESFSADFNGLSGKVIIVGLLMKNYEESRSADLHHAIIMASILLVLGSGLIFFIFVIQNYYLVDKTLKQTRDYTRQVIANMANGLISINNAGKIVSYNKPGLDLLNINEYEAEGTDLSKIIDFETSGISEILNNGVSSLEREVNIEDNSGESLPISLSVGPVYLDEGHIDGAVIIIRDLREIKRLQEKVKRSEKLAAIGKLAAGVAHEIRNPLSSIKGFAQFLRHVLKDRPEEREYANVMVHEIDRINRVVSDLLIYSKPFEIKRTGQNLDDLINHTILLVQADASDRKINIIKNVPEDTGNLWLDPNQITHALLNLLLNSLEAVSEGGNVEVGYRLIDRKRASIWVEDDGYGISDGYLEKVMDPFYTTRDKGTGLGLAIVQKIVENHNGEIVIESPPAGKTVGTRVTMIIPLSADDEEEVKS